MANAGTASERSFALDTGVPVNLPRLPTGLLERPHLFAELDSSAAFTLVHGPGGFGKTTLVVQWLEQNAGSLGRVIWISLRKPIESADQMWRVLADELRKAGFDLPDGVPQDAVRSALQTASEPVVIVVDGFALGAEILTDRPLFDLARSQRNVRVIICLRQDPPFMQTPTADVDIRLIGPERLQFSGAESDELLRTLVPDSTALDRKYTHEQVGGWPYFVRAAGLDKLDLTRIKNVFRADRPAPLHDPNTMKFVLQTVIVEEFSADEAQILTADPAVQQRIPELLNSGVLQQRSNGNFAYVPAVRQVISSQPEPEEITQMHLANRRMAQMHLSRKNPVEALQHAAAALDWELLERIVEQHWNSVFNSARVGAVLAHLPVEAINAHTSLRFLRQVYDTRSNPARAAGIAMSAGSADFDSGKAGRSVRDVYRFLLARTTQAGVLRFQGHFAASGKLVETLHSTIASASPEEVDEAVVFLPTFYLQWGLTELLNDDLSAAAASLSRGFDLGSEPGAQFFNRNCAGALALIFALNGDLVSAELWLRSEAELPDDDTHMREEAATCGKVARVLCAVDRWDRDAARGLLSQMRAATSPDEMWPFIAYADALLGMAEGSPVEQLQRLSAAQLSHPSRIKPGSTSDVLIRAVTADLLMMQSRASHAAAQLRGGPKGHPLLKAPRARLELLRGNPAAALRELAGGRGGADFARNYGELRLLTAVAQLRTGNEELAAETFAEVAAYLLKSKILYPFRLIDPADLVTLLEGSAVAADELVQFTTLDALFPRYASVITLSEREHIVLTHLDDGLALAEIAAFLVVSPNTVKSQTRSIYKKMGVSSRDEAVTLAQELGMLTAAD